MIRILFFRTLLCVFILYACGCKDSSETQDLVSQPPKTTDAASPRALLQIALDDPGTVQTPSAPIRFEPLGKAAGIEFTRFDDMRGQHRLLETNGGGVAVLDADADGWPDVFFSNGCKIPLQPDDHSTPGALLRNRAGQRFEDISRHSGLMQYGLGFGCAVSDVNNDGFDDLCVTRYGTVQLWLNCGDGTFLESAESAGLRHSGWGSSAAFADLNSDGNVDLYVVNYVQDSDSEPRLCPEPASPDGFIGCSPALFEAANDQLYLSDAAGGFVNISQQSGLNQHSGKGLGIVICDLDEDRRPEICVANDGEANFLFSLQPLPDDMASDDAQRSAVDASTRIRLKEQGISANFALNELGYAQAGMGIAAADFDRNGQLDLFLTHFYGDTNTLYENASKPGQILFRDATRQSRLGPPSRDKLGFGVVAADFNLDGWPDLITANGHVDDRTWLEGGQPYHMQTQLFQNQAGQFRDVSGDAGDWFSVPQLGRGLAHADFDRNGLPDAAISSQLQPAAVLINTTRVTNSAIRIRFVGRSSSRTPTGLLSISETQQNDSYRQQLSHDVQQLAGGGSFQSCSESLVIFPTPPDKTNQTRRTIEIHWPSQQIQTASIGAGMWVWVEGQNPLVTPM